MFELDLPRKPYEWYLMQFIGEEPTTPLPRRPLDHYFSQLSGLLELNLPIDIFINCFHSKIYRNSGWGGGGGAKSIEGGRARLILIYYTDPKSSG
jgi:hypothetical protein